jgi:glycosyltransferase involved in cell wall biosynthesis
MRVLQIVQKSQRRGAEVFAYQLGQEQRRQGHQVQTVYLYPFPGVGSLPLHERDCVLDGQEQHPFERLPGIHPGLLRRLGQQIGKFQPDVVQVNGGRAVKYGAFCRLFNAKSSWVLVYRNIGEPGDWVRGRQRRLFYQKLVMPRLDGVVSVSQITLEHVRDFYDLSIPMTCIPNGVDANALVPAVSREAVRQNTQTPSRAPVFLSVGSLTPEKHLDRLLRIVQSVRVNIPGIYLWLDGDGPLRANLEQQAKSLGIAETVRFLGIQTDVASYLAAADLFVLTSDTEGVPAAVLEAGLLDLPVVATQVGGLPECVLDGETGLLVEPQDEEGLARALCILLQDPVLRNDMGARAKEWVSDHFTLDKIAQQYLDFYRQVLAA